MKTSFECWDALRKTFARLKIQATGAGKHCVRQTDAYDPCDGAAEEPFYPQGKKPLRGTRVCFFSFFCSVDMFFS
jgi:hypothetical protein